MLCQSDLIYIGLMLWGYISFLPRLYITCLIFIWVTWENVKMYIFYFFQICRKNYKKLPRCNISIWEPLKPLSSNFWNLFIKYEKFSFFWCVFLICSFIFVSITRKNMRHHLFQYVHFLKKTIMYCNINVKWF